MNKTEEEYVREDKIAKEQEEYIAQMCDISKRVVRKNRFLIAVWIIADLFDIAAMFIPISNGRYFAPFAVPALIVLKIVIVLIIKNSVRNIAGLIFNVVIAVLMAHFNLLYDSLPILFVSTLAHLIAIPCAVTEEKLKRVYTYPSFNSSVFCNEVKNDRGLFKFIKDGYDRIIDSIIVRYEFASADSHFIVKILRVASVLLIGAGIVMRSDGMKIKSAYEKAEEITTLEYCSDGMSVKGTVDTIYLQGSISLSANVNEEYWCGFCGQCVMFSVPERYIRSFGELYNYYAGLDEDLLPHEGYHNITESSSQSIMFTGIVRYPEKYGDVHINTRVFNNKDIEHPEINDALYIELIDKDKVDRKTGTGDICIAIGILAIIVNSAALFWTKRP